VSLAELPFLEEMSEFDRNHFRNLALIRSQTPTPRQLQLVEGLARSLSCERLLTLIARTPHWLAHGPVLMALSQNEATPELIRRDLELAVTIIDLMHGMDRAPAEEREERAQTVKEVYGQIQPSLKPIVKYQLKQLAKQVQPTGATQELPPIPSEVEDWDALTLPPKTPESLGSITLSREEQVSRAATTHDPVELAQYLLDGEAEIRLAAMGNPILSEEILLEALAQCLTPDLFEEVYLEARWYFREPVRQAIYHAPGCPVPLVQKIRTAWDLVEVLEESLDGQVAFRRIAALFTQLSESEYQYVTLWAKRRAPGLLRVVKIFYDRLQRSRTTQSSGLSSRPADGRWASLEERVFTANQATQPEQLIASLRDPDPQVFAVVLENPGLTPRELLAAIPGFDRTRAEALAGHRSWGEHPAVQEALLHNPSLTASTALALLQGLDTPRALLDLLRDGRIPHMDLKERAMEKLRHIYLGRDVQQRVLMVKSSGGELIRHLVQDVLRDEAMLGLLLADRQLDPSILLRLARNKQTPRATLQQIGTHPILMAHPAIMSELLLNPKTPRESAIRIWGLLSDSEQQQLLRSPHLPATLRYLGS
jgi:hypothetical protein